MLNSSLWYNPSQLDANYPIHIGRRNAWFALGRRLNLQLSLIVDLGIYFQQLTANRKCRCLVVMPIC